MKRISLALFSVAALALAACGSNTPKANGFIIENPEIPAGVTIEEGDIARDPDGRPYRYELLGDALPNVTGAYLNGTPFTTEDLKGNWTVVDVWGLWCPDCMADAPSVAELATKLESDARFNFVSIHTPPNAARADEAYGKFGSVDAYFEASDYAYPTVVDTDASIRDAYQIPWTPSYLLVNPEGRVVGYRTDLSVVEGDAVSAFITDIEAVYTAAN